MIKAFVGPGRHGVATPSASAISLCLATIRMWPSPDYDAERLRPRRDGGLRRYLRGHFDEVSPKEFVHRRLGHLLEFSGGNPGYVMLRSCDAEGYEFIFPGVKYADPEGEVVQ